MYSWIPNTYALVGLTTALACLAAASRVSLRRPAPGAAELALTLVATALWAAGYGLEVGCGTWETGVLSLGLQYTGLPALPILWLLFAMRVADKGALVTWPRVILLLILPLATTVIAIHPGLRHLLLDDLRLVQEPGWSDMTWSPGPWFPMFALTLFGPLVASFHPLFLVFRAARRRYRWEVAMLLLALLGSAAIGLWYLQRSEPGPFLDPAPFLAGFTALFATLVMYRYRLFPVLRLARVTALEHMRDPFLVMDQTNRLTYVNATGRDLQARGGPDLWEDAVRRWFEDGLPAEAHRMEVDLQVSGRATTFEIQATPVLGGRSERAGTALLLRDITERRALESQLRHTQKMEAIGRLAGGVAHDFNNILTGIAGYAELLRYGVSGSDELVRYAQGIIDASRRAAGVTRQLLSFSRRQEGPVGTVDLHLLVEETADLLRQTVDRRVTITLALDAGRPRLRGDASQLQAAILNLCVNARDAMPEGGQISLETRHVAPGDPAGALLPEDDPHQAGFVVLAVRDTGEGMDEEVQAHLFEPFYTTKPQGRGTGLGMAAAYGIVRAHGGQIRVDSAPGMGTTIHVVLPLLEDEAPAVPDQDTIPPGSRSGRVLVVDDEEMVRQTLHGMLERLGYQVTVSRSGREAIETVEQDSDRFDLVLLDMNMPGLGGPQTLRELKRLRPDVRVLVVTGFAAEDELATIRSEGALGVVYKPFSRDDLLQEMSRVLELKQP